VSLLHLRGKLEHEVNGLQVRFDLEQRGTEVKVESDQVQTGCGHRLREGFFRLSCRQREAEFAVQNTGGYVTVCVGVDARRQAK